MDTMRTIRTFFARLAGAPMPAERAGGGRRGRRREPSGLYEPSAETDRRTSRQRDGDEGEDFARRYLERAGLTYVAGKVAYRDGELDLVMREGTRDPGGGAPHGSMLVFVEVRRRAGAGHGGAAASVTREKRRRIVAAASHFLVGLGLRTLPRCRFDVLSIDGDLQHGFRVEWIRDAFIDEGRG